MNNDGKLVFMSGDNSWNNCLYAVITRTENCHSYSNGSAKVKNNEWNHIAVIKNGYTVTFFINNVKVNGH